MCSISNFLHLDQSYFYREMSLFRGVGLGAEGTGLPMVNGNRRKGGSTDQNNGDKESAPPTTSTAISCSTAGDTDLDTDLDDRIRSALDELESPGRSCSGGNGYLLASRTRTGDTAESKVSEGSSSDSEGEVCPNAMGYMPLPQDPDTEEDNGCDYLHHGAANTQNVQEDNQECIQVPPHQPQEDALDLRLPRAASADLKKGKMTGADAR